MPTKQIVINAPAEKVFNYLADITKHSEWGNPSQKLQVEKTSGGPVGQGSTFKSVGKQFGTQNDTVTITEYVPNQKLVYQAEGNAGLIRHTVELSPSGGGTMVSKSFEAVKPKFPLTIMLPVVNGILQPRALASDLSRIKARLEGS